LIVDPLDPRRSIPAIGRWPMTHLAVALCSSPSSPHRSPPRGRRPGRWHARAFSPRAPVIQTSRPYGRACVSWVTPKARTFSSTTAIVRVCGG
jgi:hypothetical protein